MRKYSNDDIRHESPYEDVLQGKKNMINEDVKNLYILTGGISYLRLLECEK